MENTGAPATGASDKLGPLTPVAGASTIKPILYGCIHLAYALLFGFPGATLIYIGLTDSSPDGREAMLGLGGLFALIGLLILFAAIRRFAVAGHRQVRIDAGPGGVRLVVPVSPGLSGFFRLQFQLQTHELAWSAIDKWYPYLRTVNGIPTESALVFECSGGGRVRANTEFYGASRSTLADRIGQASKPAPRG